eukprot:COSAG05_NODE_2829_length_2593_cov_1.595830_1_plen_111_part_00
MSTTMLPLNLSRSTLEAILLEYPMKKRPLAPKSIKSIMSNVTTCHAHIHGDSDNKPDQFGDLTYITLNALKNTKSQSTKYKALYGECSNDGQRNVLQKHNPLVLGEGGTI